LRSNEAREEAVASSNLPSRKILKTEGDRKDKSFLSSHCIRLLKSEPEARQSRAPAEGRRRVSDKLGMVIGHQKQWQFLKKSAELGKLPHALLFTGQEKLGKRTMAIEFAKWLLKEDIEKKQHPDFNFITPAGKEIQISQIRELIWKLSLKPSQASFKIAIIDEAHCLNQDAQNCFLKTLEEPRGQTLIILITEMPELLFPTIISRCEFIKFYPVPKKEIEDYLKEQGLAELRSSRAIRSACAIEEKEIQVIAQICQGRPGVAIEFLNDIKKMKERDKKINELAKLTNSGLSFRFQYAKTISETPGLKEILNTWLSYFRDILLSKLSENQKISEFDINRLKQIQKINFLISTTNINPRLALEILMLDL